VNVRLDFSFGFAYNRVGAQTKERVERKVNMLLTRTQKIKNVKQNPEVGVRRFSDSKTKMIVPAETTDLEDGDEEMTLDEQIESLKRVRAYGRRLAAEQGVFFKDDEE